MKMQEKIINNNELSFSLSADEVAKQLLTDKVNGLTSSEVLNRRNEYGKNILLEAKKKNWFIILLSQFKNLVVYLLLAAALVSFSFNNVTEGLSILVVILVNAAIGFGMEFHALSSMASLKEFDKTFSKVFRDGRLIEIHEGLAK